MVSPGELVRELAPGLDLDDLTTEEAAAVDHAIRNHTQTVWALEEGLRQTVLGIIKGHLQAVRFRGRVYTLRDGRLMILR